MVSMSRKRVKLRNRRGGFFSIPSMKDGTGLIVAGLLGIFVLICCLVAIIVDQTRHYYNASASASLVQTKLQQLQQEQEEQQAYEFNHWLSGNENVRRQVDPNHYPREDSLRYSFDLAHDVDLERTKATVRQDRLADDAIQSHSDDMSYDIFKCPPQPPEGYPHAWNIIDVLSDWNPDDTDIPSQIYQGICWFDWYDPKQREMASTYRKAELPFGIRNHHEIWQTAERWSAHKYLLKLLGPYTEYKTEHSKNNHMMYWKTKKGVNKPEGWEPPTDITSLKYADWYDKAVEMEKAKNKEKSASAMVDRDHWYFRLNAAFRGVDSFVYDELPMFVPDKPKFFIVDPSDQRGINCRFGMKGIIAEAHYDFSRNFVFILKGAKRYILAHPDQCQNMMLYPQGHPSARHASLNWSNPEEWHTGKFPEAQVQEVVLQAGDALYLPTAWFHFIVSLNLNYQCNARSGITYESRKHIKECGFS